MKSINLNERTSFYASDELIEQLKSHKNYSEPVINFAYTDYGGSFFDRVLIAYFEEKHPDFIVSESTAYFGKNALVFGPVAAEFLEAYEGYPLGFEDTEEYYSQKETETKRAGFEYFLKEGEDKFEIVPDAIDKLMEEKGGHFSIQSSGELDFCWSDLEQWCLDNGLFTTKE